MVRRKKANKVREERNKRRKTNEWIGDEKEEGGQRERGDAIQRKRERRGQRSMKKMQWRVTKEEKTSSITQKERKLLSLWGRNFVRGRSFARENFCRRELARNMTQGEKSGGDGNGKGKGRRELWRWKQRRKKGEESGEKT